MTREEFLALPDVTDEFATGRELFFINARRVAIRVAPIGTVWAEPADPVPYLDEWGIYWRVGTRGGTQVRYIDPDLYAYPPNTP